MGDPVIKKSTKQPVVVKKQPVVTRTLTANNGKVISTGKVTLQPSSINEMFGSKKNGGSLTKKAMGGKVTKKVMPKKGMGGKMKGGC